MQRILTVFGIFVIVNKVLVSLDLECDKLNNKYSNSTISYRGIIRKIYYTKSSDITPNHKSIKSIWKPYYPKTGK